MVAKAARLLALGRQAVEAVLRTREFLWLRAICCLVIKRVPNSLLPAAAAISILGAANADSVSVMERPRPAYDAKGIPLGAFRMFPALTLGLRTTDNVFDTENGAASDVFGEVAPQIRIASEWSQHALELFARANILRYGDNTSENVADWSVGANGKLDVRRTTAATASVWTGKLHERRSSQNSPGNIGEPVTFDQFHAEGGLAIEPNHLRLFVGIGYDRYDFDATPLVGGGFLNNRDRDRDELRLRARISLEVSEGYLAFVEAIRDHRSFDTAIDRTGVNRDSDGSILNAGLEFRMAEVLHGEAFVGYLDRQFGAPLQDVSGLNYGASLKWLATPLTTVSLNASRAFDDTIVAGSTVISNKTLGIAIDHELRRNVIIQAGVTHIDGDFVGSPRNDTDIEAHIGATYLIDSNLRATAGYEHRERDSNAAGAGYSEDTVNVGLHFQL